MSGTNNNASNACDKDEKSKQGDLPTREVFTIDSEVAGPIVEVTGSAIMYVAALISLMGGIAMGGVQGWSSPVLPQFHSPDSKPAGMQEPNTQSYVTAVVNIGGLVGGLTDGRISDYTGRRMGLFLTCIPYTAGWLLITFGQTVECLVWGRIITGLCAGITTCMVPMYIAEIATPQKRGSLGSGFESFMAVGLFLATAIGVNTHWRVMTGVCITPVLALAIGISFMPESPVYLMSRDRRDDAKRALQRVRKSTDPVDKEIEEIARTFEGENDSDEKLSFTEKVVDLLTTMVRRDAWKPLVLAVLVNFFQVFSGISSIVYYQKDILLTVSPDLNADLFAIVMMFFQFAGTVGSIGVADRFGRKTLLLMSSIAHTVCLTGTGLFYYLKMKAENPNEFASTYSWVPVVCMGVYFIFYGLGWGPITWLLSAELAPNFIRGVVTSVAMGFNWTFSFVSTRYFINLQQGFGDHGAFWFYAVISGISIFFVIFCLPETRGKTLEEIQMKYLPADAKIVVVPSDRRRSSAYRTPVVRSISIVSQ